MEILRGIPLEFWPKFWAGVASTIAVAFLVKLSLHLNKMLRKWRFRKPLSLWEPKLGANPKFLIEEVFSHLSDLDRTLERIGSPQKVDPAERALFILCLFLQSLAITVFSSLPNPFAWLNFFTICFLTAVIVALCRPERAVLVLTVFPLSILFFATNLARGRFDQRRAEAIGKCRWHLLLAIPSTNAIRSVLRRKREHLAHVERMKSILATLQSDEEVRGEVIAAIEVLEAVTRNMRTWPDDCSAFESLHVPALSQITTLEDELDAVEE